MTDDTRTLTNKAMRMLADAPNAIFLGQGVASDGVATYADLNGVPMAQRVELPVCEELQVGMGIGLSLQGYLPILIYPRCDFLLRAADQIVNHLDKLRILSAGAFVPKVIIRTRVGGKVPLDAGPQHTQNHTAAFHSMLHTVTVAQVVRPEQILVTYKEALARAESTLVIENLG